VWKLKVWGKAIHTDHTCPLTKIVARYSCNTGNGTLSSKRRGSKVPRSRHTNLHITQSILPWAIRYYSDLKSIKIVPLQSFHCTWLAAMMATTLMMMMMLLLAHSFAYFFLLIPWVIDEFIEISIFVYYNGLVWRSNRWPERSPTGDSLDY